MNKRWWGAAALGVLGLVAAAPARADFVGAICEGGAGHMGAVATLTSTRDDGCWGFVLPTGKVVVFDAPASGRLLWSKDARSVVMVSTWINGRPEPGFDPVAVRVFRDGRLLQQHTLSAVATPAEVKASISHVHWTGELPAVLVGDVLVLRTTSGRAVRFDLRTGVRLPG